METRAFNLDQAIKAHVEVLKSTGSITGADAAELTDHLYDATESMVKQQLTTEEAFMIASKRLGSPAVLTQEYSKVNTTMTTNKIWAYMFIGFNVLFTLPYILFNGMIRFDTLMLRNFQVSLISISSVTAFHIGLCFTFIYAAKQKNSIANYITKQVETNALRAISWSFLPLAIIMLSWLFLFRTSTTKYGFYLYEFRNAFVEISLYMVILTFAFTILSLVVSVNKFEKLSLKSLFQKPGTLFLILTGLIVELLAASTRVIHLPQGTSNIIAAIFASIKFGAVYLVAAFVIAFYNRQHSWRYLIIFSAIGFILEMSVGISIDIERRTYHAAMFSSALVVGVLVGKMVGDVMRGKEVNAARN